MLRETAICVSAVSRSTWALRIFLRLLGHDGDDAADEALLTDGERERLERLRAHQNDAIEITGNPYEELNQALSKVIGAPLVSELEDLRSYICSL